VLGLTATPERLDGKGLDYLFDEMIVVRSVTQLIDDGYLIKPQCFVGPTCDLTGIHTRLGDYDAGELEEAMDTPRLVGDIVKNWRRLANNYRTVVFAAGVNHAVHLAEAFRDDGVSAAMVSGETKQRERDEIVRAWRSGEITTVTNVNVFTEGFDMPELECCVLARPTQSVTRYLQAVGRVMRPAPGKTGAIILDPAGCCQTHGAPYIDREWTLESLTRQQRAERSGSNMAVCNSCSFAFEKEPKLWLSEDQPSLHSAFDRQVRRLSRDTKSARALDICPSCGHATCVVCLSQIKPAKTTENIDDVAWVAHAECDVCNARYDDGAVHVIEGEGKELPGSTDDNLVELVDVAPKKVVVLNEYKRLINTARKRGYKRGWVYHRLRAQYDEHTLRECLPRHTGGWWRERA
jgi:superfamily II DNA or RNA helicase